MASEMFLVLSTAWLKMTEIACMADRIARSRDRFDLAGIKINIKRVGYVFVENSYLESILIENVLSHRCAL